MINYIDDIKLYIDYCKNTNTDDYINEIAISLELDIIKDKEELNKILDDIQKVSINIFNNFVNKTDIINYHLNKFDDDFNIDSFNANVLRTLIPMIKYSMISHIKTK